jgi:hypothetical protein
MEFGLKLLGEIIRKAKEMLEKERKRERERVSED